MNILFLLIPKKNVDYLFADFTVRQAVEKMNVNRYSTIPVLDRRTGHYVRSVTSSDILTFITEHKYNWAMLENIPLVDVPSSREIRAVSCYAEESDLIANIIEQNYVPVVDDKDVFIGIVTRKAVINAYIINKK